MATPHVRARFRGLNAKIVAAFSPMLVPVIAAAVVAVLLFGSTVDRFDRTVRAASTQTLAIVGVKAGLGPTGSAAFATIMNGAPRSAYDKAVATVDNGIAGLRRERVPAPLKDALDAATRTWEQAKSVVTSVLQLPVPARLTIGMSRMQTFVSDLTLTERHLETAQRASEARLREQTSAARRAQHQALVEVMLAVAAGIVVAFVLARLLAQSVLRPLRALHAGAERLGAGELSYRVGLDRGDELGDVARAFDTMAARLEDARGDLRHQAMHDALSGLPNRTLLLDRLEHALNRCQRHGGMLALLLVDLDGFKTVNDSFGHAAGDTVLVAAGQRIGDLLRTSDTVARLGGDEFAVLLEDLTGEDEAATVAERIIDALARPFVVNDAEAYLGGSVGLVVSANGLDRADDLLRNADLAMYSAKRAGRGRCGRFADAMHEAAMERVGLEADLRHAIDHDELVVHYQPTVELATGRPIGVEALVRWAHPQHGMVQPLQFIPLAEETGLIVPLGRRVLEAACRQVAAWTASHPELGDLVLHVNVSARQLDEPGLVGDVAAILDRTGLPPAALTLEITESVMSRAESAERLRELKVLGIKIAMDDFGTGYSSLGYLQRFPIDVLKIDRSFVERLGHGDGNTSLALAVVMLARSLGLTTVAEGIEDESQRMVLQLIGCRHGQGFLFARPLDAPGAEQFLVARTGLAEVANDHPVPLEPRAQQLHAHALAAVHACEEVVGPADMVAVVGRDGTLRDVSANGSSIFGYDPAAKPDMNVLDLVHPDDLGAVLESFVGTLANAGVRRPIACRVRHADGSVRPMMVVAANLLDDPDVGAIIVAIRVPDAALHRATDAVV